MKDIIAALEEIEKSVKSADPGKVEQALKAAKAKLSSATVAPLKQLESEISVWQQKLSVILKEPAGCSGMVKHAKHWIEELRKMNVR